MIYIIHLRNPAMYNEGSSVHTWTQANKYKYKRSPE